MKRKITLIATLLALSTTLLAQSETESPAITQEQQTELFLMQKLRDFNHKIHQVFIASYNENFGQIKSEPIEKTEEATKYSSKINFEEGEEYILIDKNGKASFELKYELGKGEGISPVELKDEIIKRMIMTLPKGYEIIDAEGMTLLKYNPNEEDKSAHQGVAEIKQKGNTVIISYKAPLK